MENQKKKKAFSGITGYLGYFHFSVSFCISMVVLLFIIFGLFYKIVLCVRESVCCVCEHMPHVSYVCELMCMHVHAAAHVAARRPLPKPILCFQHVGPGDDTQVARLDGRDFINHII